MAIQVEAYQLFMIVGSLLGAGWVLLQIAFGQFEKRLDIKFDGQSTRISNLENTASRIQQLELESARRDSSMALHYVLREEYRIDQVEIKQQLNQIFQLLREMSDKLDNKVGKQDCDRRMAEQ
jgi:hypothetical protein